MPERNLASGPRRLNCHDQDHNGWDLAGVVSASGPKREAKDQTRRPMAVGADGEFVNPQAALDFILNVDRSRPPVEG